MSIREQVQSEVKRLIQFKSPITSEKARDASKGKPIASGDTRYRETTCMSIRLSTELSGNVEPVSVHQVENTTEKNDSIDTVRMYERERAAKIVEEWIGKTFTEGWENRLDPKDVFDVAKKIRTG